ncbi:redoxin family protein [Candidatus Woesearchaeota archaeon]|nr:redoxin family protein [Candidatus Woesearchaeota archaeon]
METRTRRTILIFVVIIIMGVIIMVERGVCIPGIGCKIVNVPEKSEIGKAPEIIGIKHWINSKPLTVKEFQGKKIVLIDFWTYTCINCIRTLPYLKEWDEKYSKKGLQIIGIHTPEFDFEKKRENVEQALNDFKIKYPVGMDNDYSTWNNYENRYWPAKYLIDKEGYIKYFHFGEGNYEETEKKIQELLEELGENVTDMDLTKETEKEIRFRITPETYAGYQFALPRGQNLGNKEGYKPDQIVNYNLPDDISQDRIYLKGKWKNNPDTLQNQDEEGVIILKFTASSVNIVTDNTAKSVEVEVFINDKSITKEQAGFDVKFKNNKSFISIDKARLYNVINSKYGTYTLKLTTSSKEFKFSAFTFG